MTSRNIVRRGDRRWMERDDRINRGCAYLSIAAAAEARRPPSFLWVLAAAFILAWGAGFIAGPL